jgi:tryptophanase
VLCFRDQQLFERCQRAVLRKEGYITYGGIAGAAQEHIAEGLRAVLDPDYLRSRENDAAYLAAELNRAGVSTVQPPGLHAVYVDGRSVLPHLRPAQLPGHALSCQLYLDGGIRSAEVGSLYLAEVDDRFNIVTPAPFELVRLALPRNVYGLDHLGYVADVVTSIASDPERVPGYRIVHAEQSKMRPFTARLTPVRPTDYTPRWP